MRFEFSSLLFALNIQLPSLIELDLGKELTSIILLSSSSCDKSELLRERRSNLDSLHPFFGAIKPLRLNSRAFSIKFILFVGNFFPKK